MRILQLVPGTGNFYCGTCLRDHALARALKADGHDVSIAPLYLPLVMEEEDDLAVRRVFFGGVNVLLEQRVAIYRRIPPLVRRALDARSLLTWLARHRGSTRASELGPMTVSMLRGESGRQRGELDRLVKWLQREPPPEVILLATGLLVGMARRLREATGAAILCTLQGEDAFLDGLCEPHRTEAWQALAARSDDVDRFVPVSHYYGRVMVTRLGLSPEQVSVVLNGIEAEDLAPAAASADPPVLGYLAHMCPSKGLATLVDAYIALCRRQSCGRLRLHVAGAATRGDRAFIAGLRRRLQGAGCGEDVRFTPNINRAEKVRFLQSLSLFSVPATYGEAFGLYVLEALACGVPVVQPDHGAFPEVLAATGGGVLCPPDDPEALADAVAKTLSDLPSARAAACRAADVVQRDFSARRMADDVAMLCREVTER